MAFGQRWKNPIADDSNGRFSSRIAPELSGLLAKAHQGTAKGQTVKVIVQYKQVPTAAHYATMQSRGGSPEREAAHDQGCGVHDSGQRSGCIRG